MVLVSELDLQAALGHASAVETSQVYLGFCPDKDHRTRAAMNALALSEPASALSQAALMVMANDLRRE